ncbi:MAG: radical SAM family heme chaperone HemW [Sphingobacteriales bacterium]|nr:radical SAM family heme chaperone HemW [Sphingobacteriales bacterium]
MAGIYIHIPFCKQACHYCNFHFSTSLKFKNDFIDALLREMDLQKKYLGKEQIKTIYLGGGTPSILTSEEIKIILDKLYSTFPVASGAEISLEANPDDINPQKLKQWKQSGINRFSIGIQSFFNEDLQWMNRVHNASDAERCIKEVREAGFENFSIDLIYGGPTLSDEHWQQNITKAITLNASHISCYALTVEPKTALDKLIQVKKKEQVDPEKQALHFLFLMKALRNAGYEHYEISNFAKPGYRSMHNSSYWKGESYLGLGPSAHSFNGNTRQWNVSNNALYIQSLKKNELNFEAEVLTVTQQLNEYIMTSLRTMEGLNLIHVKKKYGEAYSNKILTVTGTGKYKSGLINFNDTLFLTDEGKLFADGIAADLFF